MQALIIIDMLKDFVDGKLPNPQAHAIVPAVRRLLDQARRQPGWLVVFSNDAHLKDDPEMAVWGEHAMAGTPGAQVIEALRPVEGAREIVSPKRHYGAFEGTGLQDILRQHGVTSVVLTGQHTHCCVRHSAYGAFVRGFRTVVPQDAVCVFEGVDHDAALEYLRTMYAATLTTSEAVIGAVRQAAE